MGTGSKIQEFWRKVKGKYKEEDLTEIKFRIISKLKANEVLKKSVVEFVISEKEKIFVIDNYDLRSRLTIKLFENEDVKNHFIMDLETSGFNDSHLKIIADNCFEELLIVMEIFKSELLDKQCILEIKAYDFRTFTGSNELTKDLMKSIDWKGAYFLILGDEKVNRRYLLYNYEEEYVQVLQGFFDGILETSEMNPRYYNLGYRINSKYTTEKGLRFRLTRDNSFFNLHIDVIQQKVKLTAATRKRVIENEVPALVKGSDVGDLESTFDMDGFDLEKAIQFLLNENALQIVVNDGLWGMTLENYINKKLRLTTEVSFFYKTMLFTKFQHVLDYYGQINNCTGEELNHIDQIRFENPELVTRDLVGLGEYKSFRAERFYKIKLNNIGMLIALEKEEIGPPVLILKDFGLYEDI